MGILLASCRVRLMAHCVTSRSTRVSVHRSPDSVSGSIAPSATIDTRYSALAARPRSVPMAAICRHKQTHNPTAVSDECNRMEGQMGSAIEGQNERT